ncbi:SET domain-containing protein [Gautieria morchelliformis]|nr:SET domain-containing protein [Gautieria morchelliformis]
MTSFASKQAQRNSRKPKSFINPSNTPAESVETYISSTSTEKSYTPAGLYSGLPSNLEPRRDEVKGRGIWSKQVFKRGSILLNHRPHVSVVSTPNLSTYCSFCVSTCKNNDVLKRCAKCKIIWYCSSKCQNDDWALHKYECSAINKWVSNSPDGSVPGEAVRSLGRLLWGRKVEGETSPWWREIQALQSHRSSLPPSAVESHTRLAHALVHYLSVASPVELSPYGIQSSGDLVDLISRFTTNTFTLTSPTLSPLGTCVSPLAALFNHSCLPNAVIVFPHTSNSNSRPSLQEPVLHVVALRNISPGEEVLTAYIDTTLPAPQRQQSLQATYNFTCACVLCSHTGIDAREAVWCPKVCGGLCPAPFGEEQIEPLPRCANCRATYTQSAAHDIEDQRRIGQEALDKATSLQFSDPPKALNLTSHMIPLLERHFPPSAHPHLALLRLHQSLLITALASSTDADLLDNTIRATARAVAGITAVLDEGHPVRGVGLAELGKLLAVDEPPPPPTSTTSPSNSSAQSDVFPPTGAARLRLAIDTLKRALKELMIGFGESTWGGEVGTELREEVVRLEKELSIWQRGVKNALQNIAPGKSNGNIMA